MTAEDTTILANVVASLKVSNIQVALGLPSISDVIRRLKDTGFSSIAADIMRIQLEDAR